MPSGPKELRFGGAVRGITKELLRFEVVRNEVSVFAMSAKKCRARRPAKCKNGELISANRSLVDRNHQLVYQTARSQIAAFIALKNWPRAESSAELALREAEYASAGSTEVHELLHLMAEIAERSGKKSESLLLTEQADRYPQSGPTGAPGGSSGFYSLLGFDDDCP